MAKYERRMRDVGLRGKGWTQEQIEAEDRADAAVREWREKTPEPRGCVWADSRGLGVGGRCYFLLWEPASFLRRRRRTASARPRFSHLHRSYIDTDREGGRNTWPSWNGGCCALQTSRSRIQVSLQRVDYQSARIAGLRPSTIDQS
jgi:hypothetical protein